MNKMTLSCLSILVAVSSQTCFQRRSSEDGGERAPHSVYDEFCESESPAFSFSEGTFLIYEFQGFIGPERFALQIPTRDLCNQNRHSLYDEPLFFILYKDTAEGSDHLGVFEFVMETFISSDENPQPQKVYDYGDRLRRLPLGKYKTIYNNKISCGLFKEFSFYQKNQDTWALSVDESFDLELVGVYREDENTCKDSLLTSFDLDSRCRL